VNVVKGRGFRRGACAWWLITALCLGAPSLAQAGACGVVTEPADWTRGDEHGDLSARGEALCRALGAAAIRHYATEDEALAALAHGAVDAVAGVTPGQQRARDYGVTFEHPFLRDEIRFMVRGRSGIATLAGLSRRTVCFISGEAGEAAALDAAHAAGVAIIASPFEEEGEMGAALAGGRCAAVASTRSRLAALASQFGAQDFALLPGAIGEVPAAIARRSENRRSR
jgi:ABC-type amino acid transport substrate-binding protein